MALSIAGYYQPSNWFEQSTATRNITGVAWSSGDIIVVVGVTEDNTRTLTAPTNANLTFTQQVASATANECKVYIWTATAGSSQTSQTIASTISASGSHGGLAVWVITGSPTGIANATSASNETAASITAASGDVVIFLLGDWNATTPTKTPATGSGTATERIDTGNGSTYGIWAAEWVGTAAGTFSFGPNNYTGLKAMQASIRVTAPAGGGSVTGTAVGNYGFTGTVIGTPDVAGVLAGSFGFTGTVIGQPGNDGTAVGDFGFTGTAVGVPGKSGVAGSSFGFTGTATVHDDILFSSNRTGNYEIYRRYPDGTVVQLTNNTSYDSFWPRSSPDGTKILFVRSAVGFHDTDITKNHTWTMNRDGSSQTNILPLGVDSWAVQGHPWWSPDGTKIVTMGGAVDLYTCNADGSSRALLTTTGQSFGLSDPSYTPDGTKILYCYGGNIWYVPAAGGTPTAVTTGTHEYYDPTADSASTTVAFLDHSSGNPVADWNIKTININGTGLTTVIADGNINSRPEWGKGDDFLYFHRNPPASGETGTFSIYKIRPNGTGLTPVLTGAGSSVSEYPGLTKVVANTGTAASLFGFTGTVVGTPDKAGTAVGSFDFTATVAGTPDVAGVIATSFGFTATAVVTGSSVTGTAAGDFGFTGTAVGQTGVDGTATGNFGFTATATTGIVIPYSPWTLGSDVGVPTGTSLTTRTALGSPTSTGTYTLVDPTGRQSNVTVDVDIFEDIKFTTNRVVAHRTTGNVRLFRNCEFNILNEVTMVECDEEGTGGTTGYMTPRQIFDHCSFNGESLSSKALSGGNFWLVYSDIRGCEDGSQGPFCSVFIHSNVVGNTDGLADPHSDGVQLMGIGKAVFWNNHISAGEISGAASQALRIGAEFGENRDVYIRWNLLDGAAGGWTLQARGDNNATYDNWEIYVEDNVILPGGFGSVDFVESYVTAWARNYSDTYGGTLVTFSAPFHGTAASSFGFSGTAVGTASGGSVTGTGVGSFGFTGVAVGKRQKWEDYTHNFPGSSGYDSSFFNAPYGDIPTVGSNKMTFPAATSTYSGIQTSISKSLIGSYFLVQLDPRSTGGYSGFSVKDAGTNTDILQISYRAQAGVLEGKYYGSNWSDTDSSSTPAFTATTVWFRASESGGIVYLDKYVAGSGWVTVHADTASASALTALANCKIELNCGPFGTAMTTGPSFANINIPPSDNPVGSSNFGFTATAVGTKEVAGTIATNFGFTATARTVGNDITGTAVGSFGFTARVLIPGGATQSMKVWNGSAWLNGVMKVYNGTSWVTGSPRVWDGTNWIPAGGSSGGTTGGETLMSVMLQSMTKPHEGTLDGVPSGYDWASGPRIGASQPATAAYINGWGEAYTSGGNIPANVHVEIRNLKCAILVDGTWSVVQSQLPEGTLQPEGAYFLANFAANESKSGTYIEDGVFKGTPHTTPEDGKIWNMHFWTTPRAAIPVGNVDAVACWFEARLAGTGDIANSHVLVGAGVDWYETATTGYLGDACIGHHAFLTGEWTTHLAHSRGLNIATNPPPVALPYDPGVWEFPFNTVKIMPLGDSITGYQATDSTGWTTMTSRLAAQGITITTVGSQTDGYGGLRHEGHGGWCLDNTANACFHPPSFQAGGINDNIVSWLNTYDPQIIVLNAGANDAFTGRETQLGDFLDTCLDLIHATKPNAYVLVARPKSWSDIPNDNAVDIGGRSAEQLDVVAAKQALGYNVRAFNAYTSFTGASTSDWRDYIHPSAQGVGKMMDNTYAAILQLVDLNAV